MSKLRTGLEKKVEVLEELTADRTNLGAVEITVSVGVLVTTNEDIAGNETVSFHMHMKFCCEYSTLICSVQNAWEIHVYIHVLL